MSHNRNTSRPFGHPAIILKGVVFSARRDLLKKVINNIISGACLGTRSTFFYFVTNRIETLVLKSKNLVSRGPFGTIKVQLIIPDEQPCFDLTQIRRLISHCWIGGTYSAFHLYLCFLLDGRYV